MSLKDKTIVVTGGSRGLGLGLVEALVDQGAKVTVVARDQAALAAVKQRLGVAMIPADVTDEGAAQRILADVRPDILVLNAGATPRDGSVGPAELGGFHRTLGDRRQGRALLAAGGAQPAAQAGKPRPGGIERRGRERIADVGRLCRRQAHALDHGQIRQWGRQAEGARHPLPGDRASADHRRDRGRRRRRPAPTPGRWASSARRSWPGSARRCRPANSATTWSRCWTIRSTPRASPSA